MYNAQNRVQNARSNTTNLQDAVRRRLMKDQSPMLKTVYDDRANKNKKQVNNNAGR